MKSFCLKGKISEVITFIKLKRLLDDSILELIECKIVELKRGK